MHSQDGKKRGGAPAKRPKRTQYPCACGRDSCKKPVSSQSAYVLRRGGKKKPEGYFHSKKCAGESRDGG